MNQTLNQVVLLTFLCLLVFFINVVITKTLIKQLPRLGLIDTPSSRRAHQRPTPRGGGIAIVLCFIFGFSPFEYIITGAVNFYYPIISVLLVIATVSLLDDIKTIPILARLAVHLVCASAILRANLYPATLFHQELPYIVDFILAVIGLTAFLNIYNFLDGIDGISAAQTIHLTVTMLIICYLRYDIIIKVDLVLIINLIMLSSVAGFMIFNWHPAKIFLGDVGSISIGFLLGLSLVLIAASGERLFVSAFVASLYYLADGGLTILIRLINKEKIWLPHLKHFFQKAIKTGKTQPQVVGCIMTCNFLLMILAVYALYSPVISAALAIIVVTVTLVSLIKPSYK